MRREVGQGVGRGNQFFLREVAILNTSPRDPDCCSLEAVIKGGRGMDYWESAPSAQSGYVRPGGPSSA